MTSNLGHPLQPGEAPSTDEVVAPVEAAPVTKTPTATRRTVKPKKVDANNEAIREARIDTKPTVKPAPKVQRKSK